MFIIISKRKLEARVEREAEIRAGEILDRYAHNPALLRHVWRVSNNFGPESVSRLNVRQSEILLKPITLALKAAGAWLRQERANVGRAV